MPPIQMTSAIASVERTCPAPALSATRAVSALDQPRCRAIKVMGTQWSGTMVCRTPTAATAPTSSKPDESLIAGYLQILGDGLELINRCAGLRALRIDHVVQTMIQVIVDEGLFGLAHRTFGGMQLLRDIQTRPSRFDH